LTREIPNTDNAGSYSQTFAIAAKPALGSSDHGCGALNVVCDMDGSCKILKTWHMTAPKVRRIEDRLDGGMQQINTANTQ
jgi:hypothetical protein